MVKRTRDRLGIAVLLLAVGLAHLQAATGDAQVGWPCWRGSSHNGISAESALAVPAEKTVFKQLWKKTVGVGFSSLAVSQGRVYTLGNTAEENNPQDMVYCLDVESGREIWTHRYPEALFPKYYEGGPSATPTVDGDRVYTISKQGKLFCLDAGTGAIRWQKDIKEALKLRPPTWGFAGSVYVWGDKLLLNAGAAGLALKKDNGDVIWSSDAGAGGYSTPVLYEKNGTTYMVLFGEDVLNVVRAEDGKKWFSYPWKTAWDVNAADPIVHGDKVFISSGYDKGAALLSLADKPALLWQNKNMRNHFNSSVLWQGHLYGVDEDQLSCLDFATGTVKWTHKGLGKGSLMMAGGNLLVLGEKGAMVVAPADPQGFKPICQQEILSGRCWTTPVLAGGKIFARNAQGEVVCLAIQAQGPAPAASSSLSPATPAPQTAR